MSNREQIRLELVKALLAEQASMQLRSAIHPPLDAQQRYPGLIERVDALESIVLGGPSSSEQLVAAERERIIKLIEGGYFLHAASPASLFAKEVVAAIRRTTDPQRHATTEKLPG